MSEPKPTKNPKVFISYSWSSPAHKEWVKHLASELVKNGVSVTLDQWDLKPGDDTYAFMERMVSDSTIEKVIMVCDSSYAEKADAREKGVGTEAQIISSEIYQKTNQEKFIPVLVEKSEDGTPFLPIYCKSRFFIDMSNGQYDEGFEELLKTIHNEPLHLKPKVGNKPDFSSSDSAIIRMPISASQTCNSIRQNKNESIGLLDNFFSDYADNMKKFRIRDSSKDFEPTIQNIKEFLPHRNEAIKIFSHIARYSRGQEATHKIHKFFEKLMPYLEIPEIVEPYHPAEFDTCRFLIHELFLYAMASLLKQEQFENAAYLMGEQYYFDNSRIANSMHYFWNFNRYLESFDIRNKKLNLKRSSLHVDIIKERAEMKELTFDDIMQADFVLSIKSVILAEQNQQIDWIPETLIYASNRSSPFEIFARAQSKRYFTKIKCLWGIQSPSDIAPALETLISLVQNSGMHRLRNIKSLAGYNELCQTP